MKTSVPWSGKCINIKIERINYDFVNLVKRDIEELKLELSETDIKNTTKQEWKKFVNEKVSEACLRVLTLENTSKTKTKHIVFENLKMREYLKLDFYISLSKN